MNLCVFFHSVEMKAIEKKMKLQEVVLIPSVLDILGDQVQVTDSIDLEVQHDIYIDQEVEVQEFAIISFPDIDPGPVHHIEWEIHLEVVQRAIDQLALKGYQGDQWDHQVHLWSCISLLILTVFFFEFFFNLFEFLYLYIFNKFEMVVYVLLIFNKSWHLSYLP